MNALCLSIQVKCLDMAFERHGEMDVLSRRIAAASAFRGSGPSKDDVMKRLRLQEELRVLSDVFGICEGSKAAHLCSNHGGTDVGQN